MAKQSTERRASLLFTFHPKGETELIFDTCYHLYSRIMAKAMGLFLGCFGTMVGDSVEILSGLLVSGDAILRRRCYTDNLRDVPEPCPS